LVATKTNIIFTVNRLFITGHTPFTSGQVPYVWRFFQEPAEINEGYGSGSNVASLPTLSQAYSACCKPVCSPRNRFHYPKRSGSSSPFVRRSPELGKRDSTSCGSTPGDTIVYAISDRDAYRRTLELYLKDAVLSRTEQLLLWEERRRLGISDTEHDRLLNQLVEQMKRQGRTVAVHAFKKAGA
jgi:hypothetical protein